MAMRRMREEWEQLREALDAEAREMKSSQAAVNELSQRYRTLAPEERAIVDDLLAEWVLADDEGLRFDALALISEYGIISAIPSLRQLAQRLETGSSPGAPYEWAKVSRIIGRLMADPSDWTS